MSHWALLVQLHEVRAGPSQMVTAGSPGAIGAFGCMCPCSHQETEFRSTRPYGTGLTFALWLVTSP